MDLLLPAAHSVSLESIHWPVLLFAVIVPQGLIGLHLGVMLLLVAPCVTLGLSGVPLVELLLPVAHSVQLANSHWLVRLFAVIVLQGLIGLHLGVMPLLVALNVPLGSSLRLMVLFQQQCAVTVWQGLSGLALV